MISKEIIEQVRAKSDIVTVISRFVDLQKKGVNYVSCCPFLDHEDSKPSFSVSQSRQIFKCFGCGRGGNVFTFLMEYERLSFPEAVRYLAKECGVKIEYEKSDELIDYLYQLFEEAAKFYQANMLDGADNYFKQRGISNLIIEKFRLGFAHNFASKVRDDRYSNQVLEDSGLFYQSNLSLVDIFEDRYVFPLIDVNGRVIGFGGRSLEADPVYRNSSGSRIYSKSEFLYGLYQAKDSIVREGIAIVVEGYFDVLSLAGAGVRNVVALCGSEMTDSQAKLLARFCKKVCLFFDGDDAGRKAICNSFPALYSQCIEVEVYVCPEGYDPDSLLQKSYCGEVDTYSWFDLCLKKWGKERDELILFVRTVANKIENPDRRRLFFERCANELDVSVTLLYQKKLSVHKSSTFSKVIEENKDILMLLSGLLLDKSGFDDLFVKQFYGDGDVGWADESLKKVLTNVKEFGGDEASLFDGLDQDGSKLMSTVLTMSKSNPGVNYSISLMKKKVFNGEMSKILEEIKKCEKGGEDCSELMKKFDKLLIGVWE